MQENQPAPPATIATNVTRVADLRKTRTQRALLTSAAGVAVRALTMALRLITVPLAIALLGPARYGLWLAVGSITTWLGVSEFGIGASLLNAVSYAYGENDTAKMKQLISTAFYTMGLLCCGVACVCILLAPSSYIAQLLGTGNDRLLAHDTYLLLLTASLSYCSLLLLNVVTNACLALQEGYLSSLYAALGLLITLGSLFFVQHFNGGLLSFALAMSAPIVLGQIALFVHFFLVRHRNLAPSIHAISKAALRTVLQYGLPLFAIQIGDSIILYSANILISNRFGPAEVPPYAVPYSILMIAVNLGFTVVQPYWTAIAEARQRHDFHWIRQTCIRLMSILSSGMLAFTILAHFFGDQLVFRYARGLIVPPHLWLWLGLYGLLKSACSASAVFAGGLGLLRPRAYALFLSASIHIGGFYVFAPTFGILALPIAGILGHLADVILTTSVVVTTVRNALRTPMEVAAA